MIGKLTMSMLAAVALATGCATTKKPSVAAPEFRPGAIWPDEQGVHINSHGGGILRHDGRFYWFGEHKVEGDRGNYGWVGVSCYSSTDLYHWRNEGIALPVSKQKGHEIEEGCILERPKVVRCPKTGKFVMWFHLELKGQGYGAARTGVAVADKVTGPYTYLRSYRPNAGQWPLVCFDAWKRPQADDKNPRDKGRAIVDGLFLRRDFEKGQMARDMTVFVDDDGKAYHVHSSEENYTLHISELTDDYTGFTGRYVRILPGDSNEAPALFKKDGRYYMISSGCSGWAPNAARSSTAPTIWGPWVPLGNPCQGDQANITFGAQSTHILPVPGKTDLFIFMADRWTPQNAIDGRHVWLPIEFEYGKPILRWRDRWTLEEGTRH